MLKYVVPPKDISSPDMNRFDFEFSVCTFVTDRQEYTAMLDSFNRKRLTSQNTEFIFIDNSQSNIFDAFEGINHFLAICRGEYIIICHQDVRLEHDGLEHLKSLIEMINNTDPHWAVLGNSGADSNFSQTYRHITDPHGIALKKIKNFKKVSSLDENFLIIRNGLNLGVSRDLKGFHFYGTDLCLQAAIRGYNCYVIAFHLVHLSKGNMDKHFYLCKQALIEKYQNAFRSRFMQTSCTYLFLSGSRFMNLVFNSRPIFFLKKKLDQLIHKKK